MGSVKLMRQEVCMKSCRLFWRLSGRGCRFVSVSFFPPFVGDAGEGMEHERVNADVANSIRCDHVFFLGSCVIPLAHPRYGRSRRVRLAPLPPSLPLPSPLPSRQPKLTSNLQIQRSSQHRLPRHGRRFTRRRSLRISHVRRGGLSGNFGRFTEDWSDVT